MRFVTSSHGSLLVLVFLESLFFSAFYDKFFRKNGREKMSESIYSEMMPVAPPKVRPVVMSGLYHSACHKSVSAGWLSVTKRGFIFHWCPFVVHFCLQTKNLPITTFLQTKTHAFPWLILFFVFVSFSTLITFYVRNSCIYFQSVNDVICDIVWSIAVLSLALINIQRSRHLKWQLHFRFLVQ